MFALHVFEIDRFSGKIVRIWGKLLAKVNFLRKKVLE